VRHPHPRRSCCARAASGHDRINRKTGNRLKQQNVDSETAKLSPGEDMVRGYEVAKCQYMIVEDEEVDAVQIESTRTIDIDQFAFGTRSHTSRTSRS
jgi:non-homologous end joining protein Ku